MLMHTCGCQCREASEHDSSGLASRLHPGGDAHIDGARILQHGQADVHDGFPLSFAAGAGEPE